MNTLMHPGTKSVREQTAFSIPVAMSQPLYALQTMHR